ncbi:bleomycin resistance protein [Epibacterium ulvae]|uniref:bleomycin resistance protein n=1 Tax=Epibacterium ulvae TaxID=1156985 RepID=UPI0024934C7F|nr:VOC family protein [Epibacterium ulvae]
MERKSFEGPDVTAYCKQITPFVPCQDLARQIEFYQVYLGFVLGFQADNYAFMHRQKAAIRLLQCPARLDGRPLGQDVSFYIDVEGLDALYEQLRPKLIHLPKDRVRAPFDQPYGQREFHVLDEDGVLVFFGEAISA